MELLDYLRIIRRGWATIVATTLVGAALSCLYLAVTPQQFQASAVILLSSRGDGTISDLQLGSQYVVAASATYADVIDSPLVLDDVATDLGDGTSAQQLESSLSSTPRGTTSLIDLTVTGSSADRTSVVANAVAAQAVRVLPNVAGGGSASTGQPLVDARVVDAATTPSAPLTPDSARVITLGVVLGLVLGLAATVTRQTLDTKIRRPEQLTTITPVAVLAVVPRLRRKQRGTVVVRNDPTSLAVESYRSLRTNLSHLQSAGRRSLLVTAVAGDREKAQVPVNLAWSLVLAGRRVLLIDLDLRHSAVAEMTGAHVSPGIADVLLGEVPIGDVIQETSTAGLHVVTAGGPSRLSPSDLLSAPRLEAILHEAEQQYDWVVLHVPPLLAFTDAAVVARVAGNTLVTVSAGKTRIADLRTALGVLANVRVEPLGVVLAGSQTSARDVKGHREARPRGGGSGAAPTVLVVDKATAKSEGGRRAARRAGSKAPS